LVKKLLLKPGMRAMVINAPAGYLDRITPLPEGVTLVDGGPVDWVQVFLRDKAEVDALAPHGIEALKAQGVLWLCYPKGGAKAGTDINRDKGWDVVVQAGWSGVTQIAVDEQWSALRFRPEADIRRKGDAPQKKSGAE
jgi:hypothetical protein